MADGYWASREAGTPESTIVRFLAGAGGFVIGLNATLQSQQLAANSSPARIPFDEGAGLRAFLGYEYPLAVLPQFPDAQRIITSAFKSADSARGYFDRANFTPFTPVGSAVIGAFVHHYVVATVPATRILKVSATGHIVDMLTDTNLSREGAILASPNEFTYSVSADGRAMVIEDTPTLSPAPSDLSQPGNRNVRRLAIDFTADVQVTWSEIDEEFPYGTEELDGTEVAYTLTRQAEYAGVSAVNAAGATVEITFEEQGLYEVTGRWGAGNLQSYAGLLGIQVMTVSTGETEEYSLTGTHDVIVKLPGGTQHTFTLNSATASGTISEDAGTITAEGEAESTLRALGIIYADPQVPILFYVLHETEMSSSGSGEIATPGIDTAGSLGEVEGSVTFKRTVGVLSPAGHRVLHTETGSEHEETGPIIKAGFVTGAGTGSTGLQYAYFVDPLDPPGDASYEFDIEVDGVFYKQVRCVNTPQNAPTPFPGALDRGRLFVKDIISGGFDWTTQPRYWVSVKSAGKWLFAMHRKKDLDGGDLNDLQLYAGGLDELALRERYNAYLLAAARAAVPPDTVFIAELEAGGFGAYDVGLSPVSRLPMV